MRHRVYGNQFGRNTNQAKALYRGLVSELFLRGRIETTQKKAKAVRNIVDKVITFAKKNTVASRRQVVKILGNNYQLDKIFGEIAPKLTNRSSGYTRIIRLGQRFSDTAEKVFLELVEGVELSTGPEPEPNAGKSVESPHPQPSKKPGPPKKPALSKKTDK